MSIYGSLTRGSGAILGGIISWQGFAELKRIANQRSIKKRVLADKNGKKIGETFSAGSTEDTINEALQTGDIVFFNRPCLSMRPCGSALCTATKSITNSTFDHVGMIFLRKDFKPMLIEKTFSGIKMRPWDERLSRSMAVEVIIHPLRCRRTPEMIERITHVIQETTSESCGGDGVISAIKSLSLLAKRWKEGEKKKKGSKLEKGSKIKKGSKLKEKIEVVEVEEDGVETYVGTNIHTSVANGSAALVYQLLQELGSLPKKGERGFVELPSTICPEDLLHLNMNKGHRLRDPIYVRTYV